MWRRWSALPTQGRLALPARDLGRKAARDRENPRRKPCPGRLGSSGAPRRSLRVRLGRRACARVRPSSGKWGYRANADGHRSWRNRRCRGELRREAGARPRVLKSRPGRPRLADRVAGTRRRAESTRRASLRPRAMAPRHRGDWRSLWRPSRALGCERRPPARTAPAIAVGLPPVLLPHRWQRRFRG